jgi:hypothetical protein
MTIYRLADFDFEWCSLTQRVKRKDGMAFQLGPLQSAGIVVGALTEGGIFIDVKAPDRMTKAFTIGATIRALAKSGIVEPDVLEGARLIAGAEIFNGVIQTGDSE